MGDAPLGFVELLSDEFAIGWARTHRGCPAHVRATLDAEVIGMGRATLLRPDLMESARPETETRPGTETMDEKRAFIILFDRAAPWDRLSELRIHVMHAAEPLAPSLGLKFDRPDALRAFILGSPRSGTSELAASVSRVLNLPWMGEAHAGPAFMQAAQALSGAGPAPSDMLTFMARQSFADIAKRAVRELYYYMHGSTSFLDKTPGVPMIEAAPFMGECFPDAKFIFVRRNGISNVLSRMAKFGGAFHEHCADWAAAMDAWTKTRSALPHYLEIDQEAMLDDPKGAAGQIAAYLDAPSRAQELATALATGALEYTGAGIGKSALRATGWSAEQIAIFREICGPAMIAGGYAMD